MVKFYGNPVPGVTIKIRLFGHTLKVFVRWTQ